MANIKFFAIIENGFKYFSLFLSDVCFITNQYFCFMGINHLTKKLLFSLVECLISWNFIFTPELWCQTWVVRRIDRTDVLNMSCYLEKNWGSVGLRRPERPF